MSHSPDKTVFHQVVGERLLPVECCIAGAVKAEPQSPELVSTCIRVLRGHLDIQRSCHLRVEVCTGNIVDHYLALGRAVVGSGSAAEDDPQCLEWGRAGVQRVVGPGPELFANQSAANSWIVSITFIDIDPLGPDDLSTGFPLFRSWHDLVDAHVAEELHLDGASFADECRIEPRTGHVVACCLNPVLHV